MINNTILSIISTLILIFFLKDIITLLIALAILIFCFYYLTGDISFIQNIFVSNETDESNQTN